MSELNKTIVWLDSRYRSSGTNRVPSWELSSLLQLEDPNHYFTVEVVSATIPFSFKQLDAPNNKLPVTVTHAGGSSQHQLVFDPGNYSILQLLDMLQAKVQAVVLSSGYLLTKLPTWDFVYSPATGTCTLALKDVKLSAALSVTLHWSQADLLAGFWGHSYEQDTVLSYNDAGVDTSINAVSVEAVNVSPASTLFLRSDSLVQPAMSQERLVEQLTTPTNILASIPVSTTPNSILHWDGPGIPGGIRLRGGEIREVQLYFTSTSYAPIDFRGVPWRVCLVFREMQPDWVQRARRDAVALQQESARKALEGALTAHQGAATSVEGDSFEP